MDEQQRDEFNEGVLNGVELIFSQNSERCLARLRFLNRLVRINMSRDYEVLGEIVVIKRHFFSNRTQLV